MSLVRVPLNPTAKSETKVPLSVDVVIPIGWTVYLIDSIIFILLVVFFIDLPDMYLTMVNLS